MRALQNRLQEIRETADPPMSRAALADFLGISEIQVRRLEEQKLLIPTKYLGALTQRFGVSSDHLLGLDREPIETGKAA